MPRLAGKQPNTLLYILIAVVLILVVLLLMQMLGIVHLIPATR